MSKEMLNAFAMLEEQKGIKSEIVIEAIEQAITAAYKRQYGQAQNVKVIFDEKKGNFNVYSTREVVDEVFDSRLEISLEDALELNPHYEIGDKIMFEEKPKDFARTAAGAAKQVIMQKMREEERTIIYNEYSRYKDEIIQGTVEKVDARAVYINLGRVDALLTKKDQIPQETYHVGDRVKVYVTDVVLTPKGTRVFISRTAPDMLKRMFEKKFQKYLMVRLKSNPLPAMLVIVRKSLFKAMMKMLTQSEQWSAQKVHVFKGLFVNWLAKRWTLSNGLMIKQFLLQML